MIRCSTWREGAAGPDQGLGGSPQSCPEKGERAEPTLNNPSRIQSQRRTLFRRHRCEDPELFNARDQYLGKSRVELGKEVRSNIC